MLDDIYGADDDILGWAEMFFETKNNSEIDYLLNLFWETLNTALDELSAEQKEVFVLHELGAISCRDIAEKTGVSVNTYYPENTIQYCI